MATQQKFYLRDSVTTNAGIMPGASDAFAIAGDPTGDATGARTARATSDVPGAANPDTKATFTANADKLTQRWGWRRFVTPPLAARTFATGDGTWTWGFASIEQNTGHNQGPRLDGYIWRPSTGLPVNSGGQQISLSGVEPSGTTEQWQTATATWATSVTILDGDILVFEATDGFIQGGAGSAWTSSFCYDGTTEASATTAASYVNAPVALTLYTPSGIYAQPCNLGNSPGLFR